MLVGGKHTVSSNSVPLMSEMVAMSLWGTQAPSACLVFNCKALSGHGNINAKRESANLVDLHVILCLLPLFPYFPPVGPFILLFLPRVSLIFSNKQKLLQRLRVEGGGRKRLRVGRTGFNGMVRKSVGWRRRSKVAPKW